MCRLSPHECMSWGTRIDGDDVEDAVLPALEEDQISRLDRRGDVCDSHVIAVHVVNANGSSKHIRNRATAKNSSQ